MPANETNYRRLPGSGRRTGFFAAFATRSRLWLGDDHLLGVDTTWYAEDYKRFYFRDIQAITIRKTNQWKTWSGVLLLVAVPSLALALTTGTVGAIVFGIPAGLFLLLLVINLARGPTAVCHLRTAVQVEELPSLCRLRRARKVLARLRPLIVAAQGELLPEQLQAAVAAAEPPGTLATGPGPFAPSPVAAPLRHDRGIFHLILSWLLIADVPNTIAAALSQAKWCEVVGLTLLLATVVVALVAAVKQRGTDLPSGLRRIPWLSLTASALFFVSSIGYATFLLMRDGGRPPEFSSTWEDPVSLTLTIVSTLLNATLGVTGLLLLRNFRRASSADAGSGVEPPPMLT